LDNVTHTVIGLLLGEAALVVRRARAEATSHSNEGRAPTLLASVLANNAPDIDSAYASFLTEPLGSLLHHRGHTHTFALVPPLALLAFGVTLAIARARGKAVVAHDRGWLLVIALVGVAVHIGLDAANNYGVHPFWPFYDGWIYGDAVFIIEPLIWAAAIPPLVLSPGPRWLKLALSAVVVIGVGLCWYVDFVPRAMAIAVTLLACVTAAASRRGSPTQRVLVSAGATLAVLVTFAMSGVLAQNLVTSRLPESFPRTVTHDVVLTPMPANPLCWQVLVVQTEGERYVARTGMAALVPRWMTSNECPFDIGASPTAPSAPVAVATTPALRWVREFSAPLVELRRLAKENCVFAALLQFSRVPFWTDDRTLGRVAGDLRYDRSPGLDFSDTVLDGVDCPKNLPPWLAPRRELLQAD
jgi:inner membrane protein